MSFTFLQQKEVEEGLALGLTQQQVSIYAKPQYNYLKMAILKEALLLGLKEEDIDFLSNPDLSVQEMNLFLMEIKEGKEPSAFLASKPKKKKGYGKWILLACCLFLVTLLGCRKMLQPKSYLRVPDTIEVNYQEECDPMSFIQSYELDEKDDVVVLNDIDTNKIENQILVYQLKSGRHKKLYYTYVTIVDKTPPVLTLTTDTVQLIEGSKFQMSEYIDEASDNVDGDLTSDVICSIEKIDSSNDVAIYELEDSSKNKTTAKLQIEYVKPKDYVEKLAMIEEE